MEMIDITTSSSIKVNPLLNSFDAPQFSFRKEKEEEENIEMKRLQRHIGKIERIPEKLNRKFRAKPEKFDPDINDNKLENICLVAYGL